MFLMNEDDGIIIDVRKWFPEAVRRAEILERLKRSWDSVVRFPAVSRYSEPVVLGVNYLIVEAWNDQAKSRLSNMTGNIIRTLSSWGYNAGENFTLRVNERKSQKKITPKKPSRINVIENEEPTRQYMKGAPDTLPEDINYALSHLKMYLDGRKIQ